MTRCALAQVVLTGTVCLALAGCGQPPSRPPQNLSELERHRRDNVKEFPDLTIVLHNARRVVSDGVPADQRIESLRVVEKVDASQAEIYPLLATALADAEAPRQVRFEVLAFLARRDYPGLADYVAAALPHADDAQLRMALLGWLEGHGSGAKLADVVKLWAAEITHSGEAEARYRRVVERISGKPWDQALIEALNSVGFAARGSAVEVLSARLRPDEMRQRILSVRAESDTLRAMQYLADGFGYMPRTRRELYAAVQLYSAGGQRLRLAAELADKWRTEGYRFNVRDCHLLSQLASDPERRPLSRAQLALEISRSLAGRRGRAVGTERVFRRGRLVDFDAQAESLSVADLWNVFLLDGMLARPRVRRALGIMVQRDRADRQTQWGGLVTYEQGQAEAKLYPPAAREGDDRYVPTDAVLQNALEAMCYFVAHFEQDVSNPAWIGPTKEELEFSRRWNIPGLVMTSLEGGKVDAMYFTPDGVVIDLDNYDLLR